MKKFSVPTGELRFVNRDGRKILQQRWRTPQAVTSPITGELELEYEFDWRDVPELPNDPGRFS